MKARSHFSISQALFTFCFLVFFFTLLNGYVLNLASGYQADARLVLIGLIVELAVIVAISPRLVEIEFDPFELVGFLVVVFGVWAYFVIASLPTLMPPTQSVDAVRHYTNLLFSYPRGTLVSWYPPGGAFVAAMFSHWLGIMPLRVLHPTAASFVALSAGAVYGMTCALLPPRRLSKILALVAPALLFVPWSYFAGIIDGEQYFYAQAFAQFFVIAAWWYVSNYAMQSHWLDLALFGATLLGAVAAYLYLFALPLALFVFVLIARERTLLLRNRRALGALGVFLALLALAALVLQQGGIFDLRAINVATASAVGEGGVANPSLENLGGPIFLLLALAGIPLAWRAGTRGQVLLAFLLAWLAQLGTLFAIQPLVQFSGYPISKTFYILVFPLAILAALALSWPLNQRDWEIARHGEGEQFSLSPSLRISLSSQRKQVLLLIAVVVILGAAIVAWRPPVFYSPFTENEIDVAQWAKEHLNTYEIHDLTPGITHAYWLAFGLWRETLPNEWFQWMDTQVRLGPKTFDEWQNDPAWGQWLFVRDIRQVANLSQLQIVYRRGDTAILQKNISPVAAPVPAQNVNLYFGGWAEPNLKLLGYDLSQTTFSPGVTLTVTTYTESFQPPDATLTWRIELLNASRVVVSSVAGDPLGGKYLLQRWPPGRYARDDWALKLDPGLAPGVYELQMGLYRRTDGEFIDVHPLRLGQDKQEHFAAALLTRIKIPVSLPSAEELRAAQSLDARVGDNFQLARYALDFDRATRVAHLTLYWQCLAKTASDYTVFVHALDSSGKIVAQQDAPPRAGTYPTPIWDAGEIVKDVYTLTIPQDVSLPTSIEIGMYTPSNNQRLPVGSSDHVLLDFQF